MTRSKGGTGADLINAGASDDVLRGARAINDFAEVAGYWTPTHARGSSNAGNVKTGSGTLSNLAWLDFADQSMAVNTALTGLAAVMDGIWLVLSGQASPELPSLGCRSNWRQARCTSLMPTLPDFGSR